MNLCPCCSTQLLRHARHTGVYWFCSHCWQEMPDLTAMISRRYQRVQQLERLIDIKSQLAKPNVAEEESGHYANAKRTERHASSGARENLNVHSSEFSSSRV